MSKPTIISLSREEYVALKKCPQCLNNITLNTMRTAVENWVFLADMTLCSFCGMRPKALNGQGKGK